MTDDEHLIDAALAGRSAAFGQLVLRHQDRLHRSVAHLLGSAEDARDIVQDAFVQAYLKLETFKRNSAFYTWVYRIAFNLAASARRRRTVPLASSSRTDLGPLEPADDHEAPGARLERQEDATVVRAALAALSDEHREVLVFREIDGFDYDTIAELLSVPVGTIRSRLHRARLHLREQLERLSADPRANDPRPTDPRLDDPRDRPASPR